MVKTTLTVAAQFNVQEKSGVGLKRRVKVLLAKVQAAEEAAATTTEAVPAFAVVNH